MKEFMELLRHPRGSGGARLVLGLGTVTVCTQCATRRGLTESDLLPGVRIAGAAAFAAEVLAPDAQALVY
jgi:predicted peroxiredoxin